MSQADFEKQKKQIEQYFTHITSDSLPDLNAYLTNFQQQNSLDSLADLLNSIKEGNDKKAIHFAAARGDLPVFQFLVQKGANPKDLDAKGNSVFMIAIEHQHKPLVQYLLDSLHWDVNESRNSITALHQAAQSGNIPLVELLLSHGADINKVSQYGTPLQFAAANQQNWVCEILIKKGADLNTTVQHMPSLLHLIIDQGNKDLFELITTQHLQKLDINIVDIQGWSALQLAAEKGNTEFVKKLIELGANVNYENQTLTALDLAVHNEKWDCVELLRKKAQRKEGKPKEKEAEIEQISNEQVETIFEEVMNLKKLGNAALSDSKFEEAKKEYEKALQVGEKIASYKGEQLAMISTNLAQTVFKMKGDPQEILRICEKARGFSQKWVKIYYWEGQAYEQMKEYGEAAASYFDGLKIENCDLFQNLFQEAVKKGKEEHKKRGNERS